MVEWETNRRCPAIGDGPTQELPISDRVPFHEALPGAFDRLLNLHRHVEHAADENGVDLRLLELMKIRASQINGCAHCVDLHVERALAAGEPHRRIMMLPVWRESGLFDAAESAALALAEAMSQLAVTQDVPDVVYDEAARHFDDQQLAVLVWGAAEIQAFNALNVASRRSLNTDS